MEQKRFRIKKKLGQHFLNDDQILEKIAKVTNLEQNHVIEIGPGKGALTKKIILKKPKSLVLVEKDLTLQPYLEKLNVNTNIKISTIYEDVLKLRLENISRKRNTILIGNLPYNIATTLIINLLKVIKHFSVIIFLVQSEVAERLSAPVSSKKYGRISILCQIFCNIEKIFDVDATKFSPRPKVKSTLIKIIPKKKRINFRYETFDLLLKKAFFFRRKKIRNNLSKFFEEHKLNINNILDINKRPQDFSPEEYLKIYKLLFSD